MKRKLNGLEGFILGLRGSGSVQISVKDGLTAVEMLTNPSFVHQTLLWARQSYMLGYKDDQDVISALGGS